MDKLSMGVVGVGNIGIAHARSIAAGEIPGMRLTALCDNSPARLQALKAVFPDVLLFSDHRELLKSGLTDGVIIATPHYAHAPVAVDAFKAGQHVLSEKPAGVYVRQAREMTEAARKSGRVFGIMFNQRTDPLYCRARDIVAGGQLGELKRLVWIITNWYRTQAYYDSGGWRATWSGEGGGVLLNQAPHNLDLWQWIFGMPVRLRAFCAQGKYHRIAVEDDATLYAEYENGATAVFITSTGEYPGTNRLEISGDKGKLELEEGRLRWWKLQEPERIFCFTTQESFYQPQLSVEEIDELFPVSGHRAILANFAAAVLHGEKLIAPGEEGLMELTLSNAAYLSAWTDDWVTLPIDEGDFERRLWKLVDNETLSSRSPPEAKTLSDSYAARWSVRW